MPAHSIAQRLPLHIVETIASHVPTRHYSFRAPRKDLVHEFPLLRTELLSCMWLCRLWRHAACLLFYKRAMLDNAEHEFGFYEDTLDMAQVLDVNQQHYIQEVYLAVMPEDFGPEWTIAKSEVASLIHKCGILPGVRRIYIVMMWSKLGSITDDLQLKVQSATAFVRSIREMMPRVRQITLDSRQLPVTTGTDKLFNEELLQLLGTTVSEQTTFLELRGSIIPKAFNTPQPPPLLRELILEEVKATGEAVALVRQCAGTLEKLHMLRMPVLSILKLTWSDEDTPEQTCIYPRLQFLYMECLHVGRIPSYRQPQTNPFPQLEVLISLGVFPFGSTVILSDAMSRIHHLELKMDKELYSALVDARVLARGAFTRLKFLSLNWSYDVSASNQHALLCRSLELCATTQVIRLSCMPERAVPMLCSLSSLSVLDMGHVYFTVDEAMNVLCACPSLLKANISLRGLEDHAMVKGLHAVIEEYRRKYAGHSLSVRYLGIRSFQRDRIYATAEAVVVLVDRLGSVVRVCIAEGGDVLVDQILDHVEMVSNDPAYCGGNHVQGVQYLWDEYW